jgi:hypothetical protein
MAFDEKLAKRLRPIFSGDYHLKEMKMFGGLAFMVNGHMCCGIIGDDLVVRTGPDAFDSVIKLPHARPMDFSGRPMKGFVYVGAPGYKTDSALKKWVQRGLDFVLSLSSKK